MLACEECGWKGTRDEAGEKRSRFEDEETDERGSIRILVCPECETPVGDGLSEIEIDDETLELPF
jgi:hypothetical protein